MGEGLLQRPGGITEKSVALLKPPLPALKKGENRCQEGSSGVEHLLTMCPQTCNKPSDNHEGRGGGERELVVQTVALHTVPHVVCEALQCPPPR